jgi:hypothetical protein
MALNYSDRATLLPLLSSRVSEAIRKYLLFIEGGGGGSSQGRQDWAAENLKSIPTLTTEVLPWISSETDFIDTGTSISDGAIQSRVETVLNEHYLPA